MKRIQYLVVALALAIWSCGSGEGQTDDADAMENTASFEGTEVDLTAQGMPFSITIPNNNAGDAEIMENEWGGVEIRKGEGYMITLAYGEGDLALHKSDLEGDLVYKATILDEGENYLVYKREIPDSGMDPEYHFIHVYKSGADIIEIQNMKDVIFSEEAINKMHASAKTLTAKTPV